MKRALISVSDKTGLIELAQTLSKSGYELVSTGGTAERLQSAGISVTPVSSVTGFPECLDGRVKTLHPKIHGGILAIRDNPDHMRTLVELQIEPIDLLVINLYPFRETVMKEGVTQNQCIEQIDIVCRPMLGTAAKNFHDVTVLVDPQDYARILAEISQDGCTTLQTRRYLARKVFEHTASYDAMIAEYFKTLTNEDPESDLLTIAYERVDTLRYGENPHQKASFYRSVLPSELSLSEAEQLNGKELSYNNIADTDAAVALLREFEEPTVVAVKHANPCGVGSAGSLLEAWQKAYEADSVSIYGGIVAFNRIVDQAVAAATHGVFIEVMIAPDYTPDALALLQKRKNLRVLRLSDVARPIDPHKHAIKHVYGGLLVQDEDTVVLDWETCRTVTREQVSDDQIEDLIFAMKVVKHTKSNAIVLAKDKQTVGIGPGQPNRITSVEIAVRRSDGKAEGSVMASDAFFPFDDCVRAAAQAGVRAVIHPGGSIRDQESIDACDELGLAMVFTGIRHFRH